LAQFQPQETALKFPSDIGFYRQLAIQNRFTFQLQTGGVGTENMDFVPNEGETFFFYKGTFFNNTASTANISIVRDGVVMETIRAPSITITALPVYSQTPVIAMAGDGVKIFRIAGFNGAVMSRYGWLEKTERIS